MLFLVLYGSLFTQRSASLSLPCDQTRQCPLYATLDSIASALLRSGGDTNTIRARPGHVSLETTDRNAQLDLEMRVRALRRYAGDLLSTGAGAKPSWSPVRN